MIIFIFGVGSPKSHRRCSILVSINSNSFPKNEYIWFVGVASTFETIATGSLHCTCTWLYLMKRKVSFGASGPREKSSRSEHVRATRGFCATRHRCTPSGSPPRSANGVHMNTVFSAEPPTDIQKYWRRPLDLLAPSHYWYNLVTWEVSSLYSHCFPMTWAENIDDEPTQNAHCFQAYLRGY